MVKFSVQEVLANYLSHVNMAFRLAEAKRKFAFLLETDSYVGYLAFEDENGLSVVKVEPDGDLSICYCETGNGLSCFEDIQNLWISEYRYVYREAFSDFGVTGYIRCQSEERFSRLYDFEPVRCEHSPSNMKKLVDWVK